MAINLDKIRSDLNHQDPQIQTFALMSITRLSPELVNSAVDVQNIHGKLSELVKSPDSDVVFLARKAINHIDEVFKPLLKKAAPAIDLSRANPRSLSREDLLTAVDSSLDPKYLASLAVRFIEVGEPEDLSLLEPLLSHENDRVRSNVVEVYQALGNKNHIDIIKPLMADPNNRVRGNAIMALVSLGYENVSKELTEMLCMGMISMRETAVYVLSTLKLPFVEKLLVKATSDPYEGVRLRATKALSAFVTPVAITRLRQLMNDMDINVCEAAVESLRKIKAVHEANKAKKIAQAKAQKEQEMQQAQAKARALAEEAAREKAVAQASEAAETSAAEDYVDQRDDEVSDDTFSDDESFDAAIEDSMERKIVIKTPEQSDDGEPSDKRVQYRELGTSVYQLCRTNALSHESVDTIFYEILRYQDFLRAYLSKRSEGTESDVESRFAIEQLQGKIEDSFVELGKCAWSLVNDGALDLSFDDEIVGLIRQLNN